MPRKRDESDFKKALRFCKDLSASDQKALVDALSVLNEKPSPEPPKERKAGKLKGGNEHILTGSLPAVPELLGKAHGA